MTRKSWSLSLKSWLHFTRGSIEPFVYTKDEVELMFRNYYPLLLDALKDGIVLHDDGFWNMLKERFDTLIRTGKIAPKKNGWNIFSARAESQG